MVILPDYMFVVHIFHRIAYSHFLLPFGGQKQDFVDLNNRFLNPSTIFAEMRFQ